MQAAWCTLRACALAPPGISRRMLCVSDPGRPVSTATTRFIDVLSEKLTALQQATGAYTDAVVPEENDHADA
jgi:LysR family nitrogen assimilation transcriptional regulator